MESTSASLFKILLAFSFLRIGELLQEIEVVVVAVVIVIEEDSDVVAAEGWTSSLSVALHIGLLIFSMPLFRKAGGLYKSKLQDLFTKNKIINMKCISASVYSI